MKKTVLSALTAIGLAFSGIAFASESNEIHDYDFSFEGPFGKFDQHQLQRGMQVYQEVCSSCHGLRHVAFRTLGDPGGPGLTVDQVKVFAKNYEVYDAEKDEDRPAIPSDKFPVGNDANAPDLSLMAKARAGFHGPYGLGINQMLKGMGGAEYILAILTGYSGETKEQAGVTFYENSAFPGGWISMPPPLADEQVEFADGHSNTVENMAQDTAAFLMWTAEPKMMARKWSGLLAVSILGLLTVLLFFVNKRLWAPHKRKD